MDTQDANKYTHFYTRDSISPSDLQAIPYFENDSRDLPLFIESCEEFIDTYADKKNPQNPLNSYLMKLIKSKLRGDAKYLIWIRECKTWDDVKTILKANFGDHRTEENLFNDLINFKCDGGRNYHGMGVEIRMLLELLLAKCKLTIKNPEELKIKDELYNKVALSTYLRNLYFFNKDIGNPVRFRNPKSLEEAMQFVAEEMNWQYSCNKLQHSAVQTNSIGFSYGMAPEKSQVNRGFGVSPSQQNFFPQPSQNVKSNLFGSSSFPASTTNTGFGAPTGLAFGSGSGQTAALNLGTSEQSTTFGSVAPPDPPQFFTRPPVFRSTNADNTEEKQSEENASGNTNNLA